MESNVLEIPISELTHYQTNIQTLNFILVQTGVQFSKLGSFGFFSEFLSAGDSLHAFKTARNSIYMLS